jgi:gliding motility-associated-like protein
MELALLKNRVNLGINKITVKWPTKVNNIKLIKMKKSDSLKIVSRIQVCLMAFSLFILSTPLLVKAQCPLTPAACSGTPISGAASVTIPSGTSYYIPVGQTFSGNIAFADGTGTLCVEGSFTGCFSATPPLGAIMNVYGSVNCSTGWSFSNGGLTTNIFPGATVILRNWDTQGGNHTLNNCGTFITTVDLFSNGGIVTINNYGIVNVKGTLTNANTNFTFNNKAGSQMYIGGSFIFSNGLYVNDGDFCVVVKTQFTGGLFTNNACLNTTTYEISGSNAFVNNYNITISGDYINSGTNTTNLGNITCTGNFTNSGTFVLGDGSLLTSVDWTNSGSIVGPNVGCGSFRMSGFSKNSGTVSAANSSRVDIKDGGNPGPMGSPPANLDFNNGNVNAATFTGGCTPKTFTACILACLPVCLNVASAGPDQNLCNVTTSTLAGNTPTLGTGTWTRISGSGNIVAPANPASSVTGLGIGVNKFVWTLNCVGSTKDTVVITVAGTPTTSAAGPDQAFCNITSATLAGNNPASGAGTWTLISGTGTITSPTSPNSGVTGLGTGLNVFRWTISNSPCTASTDDVTIKVSAVPTVATAGADQNVCATTATLAGSTALIGSGTWTLVSGSGTISNPSSPTSGLSGLGVGANVFRWTIANAPCASTSDDVTINVSANPSTANAGPDQSLCNLTTATITGNIPSSGTGSWSLVSGSGTVTSPLSSSSGVTGLAIGTNVFRWTINGGACANLSDDVTISISDVPTVALAGSDNTLCGTITTDTLTGNTPTVGTGTWTLVSGSGTITSPASPKTGVTGLGVGANTFRWTISNAPCSASKDDVTINVSPIPTTAAAGPDQSVCITTASATLAGNTAVSGTGTWTLISGSGTITNPSSPTSGVTGLGVGINVFRWTISSTPCTASFDEVSISVSDAPTVATAGPDQLQCPTNSSAILAGNIPIVGTGTWTLVSGSATIANPSNPTSGVIGLGVGTHVFRWTISNAPCAASSDDITIVISAPLKLDTTLTHVKCFGDSTAAINLTVTGGTTPYTFAWSNSQTTEDISSLKAGIYSVVVSDKSGCTGAVNVTIKQPLAPLSATSSAINVTCTGNKDGTATAIPLGGTAPYKYSWSGAGGTGITTIGVSGGTYIVTVTDANNCTNTSSATIKESTTRLAASITNNKAVTCKGSSDGTVTTTPVGGTLPYTYAWSPTGGSSSTASGLAGGTYTVTVGDAYGCDTTLIVTIKESLLVLTTKIDSTNAGCLNNIGTVNVTTTGGTTAYTYAWAPNVTGASSATGLAGGTYVVTITDAYGCSSVKTTTVVALPKPKAGFTPSPTSGTNPLTVNFANTTTGATIYRWLFGDSLQDSTFNTTHIYDNPGKYTVKLYVTNSFGCIDSSIYTFIQINQKSVLVVPNVFTPNGDITNDVFHVTSKGLATLQVEIYDRWGLKLYEWDTVNGSWDGRNNNGVAVPDGTYYYLLKATGEDGDIYDMKGFITLVR